MSDISKLPLNLYKANLGLQVKLGRLFQESGRQWIDYGYRLVNDGIVESNAEAEALLTAEDWQKLATLPAESFWRQLQQRFGDSQAVAQIAVTAQTDFANGLQEAVKAWQKETVEALGHTPFALPQGGAPWTELFKPWEPFLPKLETGATAPAEKAATGGRK